jgi:hypothetical protein
LCLCELNDEPWAVFRDWLSLLGVRWGWSWLLVTALRSCTKTTKLTKTTKAKMDSL